MPQPRKYVSPAQKQAAYRVRKRLEPSQVPATVPGYQKWRKELRRASELVNDVCEEIHYWMQERSERWHETDRAAGFEADMDQLEAVSDLLEGLNIWSKG